LHWAKYTQGQVQCHKELQHLGKREKSQTFQKKKESYCLPNNENNRAGELPNALEHRRHTSNKQSMRDS